MLGGHGSISPDSSCLVTEPEDVPARSVSGTTVLRISAPLLGQIESNKTEVAHIQASELSLNGSALELWTESKKMPVHDDANESSLTFLLLDVPCR